MTKLLHGFDMQKLERILYRIESLKVAVFGDFFLDKYLEVDPSLSEISLETGKIAHQVVNIRHSAGAAGTVVNNIAALGVKNITAVGFIGDDGNGFELKTDLGAVGCDTKHLHIDPHRYTPTYMKPRDVYISGLDGEYNRYDIKNRGSTESWLENRLIDSLQSLLHKLDVLIIVDQVDIEDSGAVTGEIREFVGNSALRYPNLTIWADSRRRIKKFHNVTLKMNQFELIEKHDPIPNTSIPAEQIVSALPMIEKLANGRVFVTAAERGVWVGGGMPEYVPAVRVEGPVDSTGAGDSFSAGAALSLAAGATPIEAALVGNLAASVTVQQLATTGVALPEDLKNALSLWRKLNI
jgi:rfaE bifunctional protein kinase chain/domain